VDTREIAPGLWYWTAPHPEWEPGAEPDSPGDWPQDVGCVLAEVGGEPVLIDPLVPGDGLIGDGQGGVRRCPESWFGGTLTDGEHQRALQPLLELPVRYVLLSHGEPVLDDGGKALAAAIRAPG
jgi:hypothetical protein